jgi:PPOX class probable F420-dependent enzyme
MSIADEKYVTITTLRRSGESVTSPVWIAPLADGRAGFTTGGTSGKVKRLRNNSTVTLQACSMRGVAKPGSPIVAATAVVVEGTEMATVHAAIKRKYGIPVTLISIPTAIKKLFGKQDESVGIVITFTGDAATPTS